MPRKRVKVSLAFLLPLLSILSLATYSNNLFASQLDQGSLAWNGTKNASDAALRAKVGPSSSVAPSSVKVPLSLQAKTPNLDYGPSENMQGVTILADVSRLPSCSGVGCVGVLTIGDQATLTRVGCSPNTVVADQSSTCTATVIGKGSGTVVTPTGSVTFSTDFSPSVGCSLPGGTGTSSSCSVILTPGSGTTGLHAITAAYSGDTDQLPSSATANLTVNERSTVTSVICSPLSLPVTAPTMCTGTVVDMSPGTAITPIGAVSFTSSGSGSFSPTSCSLTGTNASASCSLGYTPNPGSEGSQTITGNYAGNADQFGASGSAPLTVVKRSTSISIRCTPNSVQATAASTCTVIVTDTSPGTAIAPTGIASFDTSGSGNFKPQTCSLGGSGGSSSSCRVTYNPSPGSEGVHTITGSYAGDTDHLWTSGSFDGVTVLNQLFGRLMLLAPYVGVATILIIPLAVGVHIKRRSRESG